MIIILLILFLWLVPKACKDVFRLCCRSIPAKQTPAMETKVFKRLSELETLQTARDTQRQLIDYIGCMLCDDCTEKETIQLLRQKAIAEKQLANIEKQIYKIIAG